MYHEDLKPINGTGWKKKGNNSTFFPDDWGQDRILSEISYALENKRLLSGSKYEGVTASGLKVEIYIKNGSVSTVYPIIVK